MSSRKERSMDNGGITFSARRLSSSDSKDMADQGGGGDDGGWSSGPPAKGSGWAAHDTGAASSGWGEPSAHHGTGSWGAPSSSSAQNAGPGKFLAAF